MATLQLTAYWQVSPQQVSDVPSLAVEGIFFSCRRMQSYFDWAIVYLIIHSSNFARKERYQWITCSFIIVFPIFISSWQIMRILIIFLFGVHCFCHVRISKFPTSAFWFSYLKWILEIPSISLPSLFYIFQTLTQKLVK